MLTIVVSDYRITDGAKKSIQSYSDSLIKFPSELLEAEELLVRSRDAEILLVSPWDKIDKKFLDECKNLKYLGLCGTSTANIDLVEVNNRGIEFTNIISHDKEAVAEYYFMELVQLVRGKGEYAWKSSPRELKHKKLGIIGLGHVGQAFAHLALAYKMDISYFSPNRKMDWENNGVKYLEIPDLLITNEIIAICSPTNSIVINKEDFDLIQSNSILIQASGGTPFDKQAFKQWVGRDGNFAIFELSSGENNYNEYKDLEGVIFDRTVAGDTHEANTRRSDRIVENLKNFIAHNR